MKRILSILCVAVLVVSFSLIPAALVGADPDPGIVGLWHFDGDANDDSENGNNGTVYGATYVSGKFGQALSFDGAYDYVDCAAAVDDSITTGVTLEAWIKPAVQQRGGIISNDITYNSKKGYDFFLWDKGTYGRLYVDFGNGSALGRTYWAIPSPSWYGQWHHVAATWDGSNIKLYVDGSQVATVSYTGTYSDPGKNTFIGAINYLTPAYSYFNGIIDEVRIRDEAVNPVTVSLRAGQHMDAGTVTVWEDGIKLYVKYQTSGGWCLTETHLHVATSLDDIPQKNGNPPPAQFDYRAEHDCVTQYTYTIDLGDWVPCETDLYIAAHAEVQKVITEAPYYASTVFNSEQGLTKAGGDVGEERSTPEQGLAFESGQDESNFFSLGFGGWIVVQFDCPITNGDGDDVQIIEDTWGTGYPLETANVSASQDGNDWALLGKADNTNPDHTISKFDLGALQWAKYIKIVDTTNPAVHGGTADGFDLNAVASLQDCIQEETAWGAGSDFPGKNWATYFTYHVQ